MHVALQNHIDASLNKAFVTCSAEATLSKYKGCFNKEFGCMTILPLVIQRMYSVYKKLWEGNKVYSRVH